jgi:hypothetical protein
MKKDFASLEAEFDAREPKTDPKIDQAEKMNSELLARRVDDVENLHPELADHQRAAEILSDLDGYHAKEFHFFGQTTDAEGLITSVVFQLSEYMAGDPAYIIEYQIIIKDQQGQLQNKVEKRTLLKKTSEVLERKTIGLYENGKWLKKELRHTGKLRITEVPEAEAEASLKLNLSDLCKRLETFPIEKIRAIRIGGPSVSFFIYPKKNTDSGAIIYFLSLHRHYAKREDDYLTFSADFNEEEIVEAISKFKWIENPPRH